MANSTAISRSRNDPAAGSPAQLRVVLVANPESRRVARFQAALTAAGQPAATVVSYLDLIAGRANLGAVLGAGGLLRIESPGQDFAVEKALLAEGAEDEPRISRASAKRLSFDRGRIWPVRQWFAGFRRVLHRIDRQRLACPEHRSMNDPAEIAVLFDKPPCRRRLEAAGVPGPRLLGAVASYDDLRNLMRASGSTRVFVKLDHGSSASGVVALAAGPRGVVATTTTELVRAGGETRLYNSRNVRRIEGTAEVAALIDALAIEGIHAETWIPKAGIEGHVFDLRVVVIAGRAEHVAVRMARGPITNLHLKNRRSEPANVRARMGEAAWSTALESCERAARAFPGSLQVGVDLVIAPGFRRHAVLEVNAFGDLLHGVTHRGLDTYAAEVAALRADPGEVAG